jgi:hypothetical protein
MFDVHKFSDQVIDLAERLSAMADAAQGKGIRRGRMGTRSLVLPVAGAGLFALAKSDFFARQAKSVVEEAKTRAANLPDELLGLVRETSQKSGSRNGAQRPRQTSSARKTGSARKAGSARKTSSAR